MASKCKWINAQLKYLYLFNDDDNGAPGAIRAHLNMGADVGNTTIADRRDQYNVNTSACRESQVLRQMLAILSWPALAVHTLFEASASHHPTRRSFETCRRGCLGSNSHACHPQATQRLAGSLIRPVPSRPPLVPGVGCRPHCSAAHKDGCDAKPFDMFPAV